MRRLLLLALLAGALILPGEAYASAFGCRTIDIARTGKDITGLFVVYRFHQVKRWCWRYPRVTSASAYTYISDVDPNMEYSGIVAIQGNFFSWCCGHGTSGHYSLRQGKFKNCILWFPCSRTEYPWVKIWAHGDGSYRWATGL